MNEPVRAAVVTALWCGLHSLLITRTVLAWSRRHCGRWFAWHRVAFVGFAAVSFLLLALYVNSLPAHTLWTWSGPWQIVRVAGLAAGVWITLLGIRVYDQRHFLGIKQAAEFITGRPPAPNDFSRHGILAHVRHPYYAGAFALLAFYADFTDVNLAIRVVLVFYLVVGTELEERKLLHEYGEKYARYRREVPRFLPRTRWRLIPIVPVGLVGALGVIAAFYAFGEIEASTPNSAAAPADHAVLTAAVSIIPQTYFVERIAGERVAVMVLVGPGDSPATYEPTPRQLTGLADARVYFRIGVPMEQALVPRLARNYPQLAVVDTRGTQATTPHAAAPQPTHTDDHGHDHGEHDPHVWLSPRLAADQAAVIAATLARLDPSGADLYRGNLATLQAELSALDTEIGVLLAPVRGGTIFVFHPAFGYFCGDYGLEQVAIEAGGLAPSPRHLTEVLSSARAAGARAIFVQPQSSTTAATTVATELGIEVVTLDPLARDYQENLGRIARAFRAALDRSVAGQ